jgi:surfeit locus 1 family protein
VWRCTGSALEDSPSSARTLASVLRSLLSPRMLGLHTLAIVATAAAVLLGLWQYGVWQSGREDKTAAIEHARPQPLTAVMSPDEAFPQDGVGRPVHLSGRWLPGSTLYVSGRTLHGHRGVWAVTPVEVCRDEGHRCPGAPAVLVARGWAPSVRRAPAPPRGAAEVVGWLQPGEGADTVDPHPADDVMPQMAVADAVQHVRQDLYGGYVIARPTAPTAASDGTRGLSALTPAALPSPSSFTSVRNLLYAFEWWVFGGFAVYLWWRWCRDEVTRVTGVPSNA